MLLPGPCCLDCASCACEAIALCSSRDLQALWIWNGHQLPGKTCLLAYSAVTGIMWHPTSINISREHLLLSRVLSYLHIDPRPDTANVLCWVEKPRSSPSPQHS
jgi:hypothetical protein